MRRFLVCLMAMLLLVTTAQAELNVTVENDDAITLESLGVSVLTT